MLAPQPFYQERGTPIAVNMVLSVLSERGDQVDVITYHEGHDVVYDGLTISRTPNLPLLRGVPPGISWKKLVCDVFLFGKAIRAAFGRRYQVVHAVEEGVFIALAIKLVFGIPYVYDMDSSLFQQTIEKYPRLKFLSPLLRSLERLAVRNAEAVLPVCDALAEAIAVHRPNKIVVLHDVSLLNGAPQPGESGIREELSIDGVMLMYVGNLEEYQGIDLLLDSMALTLQKGALSDLVIIGGKTADIDKYEAKARVLGIRERVHFLGPRPVENLASYLSEADILVSPRTRGQNTPMKLYSYLHSGTAVLATDIPTHTQVATSRVAYLADPTPEAFSEGMIRLIGDSTLRASLGTEGRRLIEERHTAAAFNKKLNGLYDWLSAQTRPTAKNTLEQERDA